MRWFVGSSQAWICIWGLCYRTWWSSYKHSCGLKSLSIQNTCSITSFLPTSLTTCLISKIKNTLKVNWMKLKKFFSPQMSASWCDLLNESVKKLTRRKCFLWQKISFEGMSVCRKCKHYPQRSFVLLSLYRELLVIYRF